MTGIVADAAEWAAAELAATVTADLVTFGLASLAGSVAESATLAIFVERAAKASTDLGRALAGLVRELQDLKTAREAIRAAEGFQKVRELRHARTAVQELSLTGNAYRVLDGAANRAVGAATGLPLDRDGAKSIGSVIGQTLGAARDDYLSGRARPDQPREREPGALA